MRYRVCKENAARWISNHLELLGLFIHGQKRVLKRGAQHQSGCLVPTKSEVANRLRPRSPRYIVRGWCPAGHPTSNRRTTRLSLQLAVAPCRVTASGRWSWLNNPNRAAGSSRLPQQARRAPRGLRSATTRRRCWTSWWTWPSRTCLTRAASARPGSRRLRHERPAHRVEGRHLRPLQQ